MASNPKQSLPSHSLRDKPTQPDLRDISNQAIKAWKTLMTHLGLDDNTISRCSINSPRDEAEACFQGLMYWLQENALPATWDTLVKALTKSNLGHIVSLTPYPHILSDSIMVEQGVRMEDKPLNQNKKVRAIVRLYLEGELFMPRNEDLEIEFAYIMGDLNVALDPHTISREERCCIQGAVGRMYTNITKRILPQPSPDPDYDNLFEFISTHSNPCEPFLLEVAINVLKKQNKLKKRFTKYKEGLKAWLEIKIGNFACPRTIFLPDLSSELCLAMCTTASEDQVLLAYIIELQGYLKHCLQLDCSRLLGMQKGCTIVYFIIPAVNANLLAPRIQSHLTEMKEILKFSLSYIVLIDHFVMDVESGAFEVLPPSASMTQEDFHIGTEEPEGSVEALALQLSEAKLEHHQTPDQLDDVDVQAESDLLKDTIAELEPQVLDRAWPVHGAIPVSASVLTQSEISSTSERQQAVTVDEDLQAQLHARDQLSRGEVEERWSRSGIQPATDVSALRLLRPSVDQCNVIPYNELEVDKSVRRGVFGEVFAGRWTADPTQFSGYTRTKGLGRLFVSPRTRPAPSSKSTSSSSEQVPIYTSSSSSSHSIKTSGPTTATSNAVPIVKYYVDNAANRSLGRVDQPLGSHIVHSSTVHATGSSTPGRSTSSSSGIGESGTSSSPASTSYTTPSRSYVDNAANRSLGRVGKPLGSQVVHSSPSPSSSPASSTSSSTTPSKTYVDNAANRSLGRVGKRIN